jgi:hypothetical protein
MNEGEGFFFPSTVFVCLQDTHLLEAAIYDNFYQVYK